MIGRCEHRGYRVRKPRSGCGALWPRRPVALARVGSPIGQQTPVAGADPKNEPPLGA
jgi:hypothetical protein